MKTLEQIKEQRDRLAVVAAHGSPVPDTVRYAAQNVCHTLTWVLETGVSIAPYNLVAGCCCVDPVTGKWGGVGNCSLPSGCLSPARFEDHEQ